MYDQPKAIHFVAFNRDGNPTPALDRDGLRARWRAADLCQQRGVRNMMHLSDAERVIVAQSAYDACDEFTIVKVRV